jgi:hypothetical protein
MILLLIHPVAAAAASAALTISTFQGLVGAIAITPTTFLLPPLLWLLYKKPAKWSAEWAVNWFLVFITGLIGVLGEFRAGSAYITCTAVDFKCFCYRKYQCTCSRCTIAAVLLMIAPQADCSHFLPLLLLLLLLLQARLVQCMAL